MKHILVICCLVFISNIVHTQTFSRVRVYANDEQVIELDKKGVCIDHGKRKQNTYTETDLSLAEMNLVKEAGIKMDILIEDVVTHYQNQLSERATRAVGACSTNSITYAKPSHFKLGSMGGYPTYNEVMSDLDSMYILYPSLVLQKDQILSYMTANGNTIDWMKISDNPMVDESEPEILITALHHAREPGSITQLLYTMWYILENYGTDPEITFLVDNTEIYFIPVVNPDGYQYNELIAPSGGGMWRKNRRNNGDGTYGVDLNRNYSYKWGVSGTSTAHSSDVYCGPSPFSEPETQAVRDFVLAHQFQFALNYHTYGDLLLYPYGYDYIDAVDKDYYNDITELMVCQNHFVNESAVTLYPASGDSDDWGYGDTITKPRVLAMTPEIGPNPLGFWPPVTEIENISSSTLFQNITVLNLLHYYCNANDANEEVFRNLSLSQYFKFNVRRLGLKTTGTSTVSIIPLSPAITSVGSAKSYTNVIDHLPILDSITFNLTSGILQGTPLKFVLQTTNASGTVNDTVTKYYGIPFDIFNSDFTTLSAFSNAGWSTTTEDFVSTPSCLTDSPLSNYLAFEDMAITTPIISIPSTALFAQLRFRAKWQIEKGYDFAQVLLSSNGGATFTPVCGKYTSTGTSDQDPGNPLYDGEMSNWVLEEINLNNYIGVPVMLQVIFKSDPGVQMDGFYMDDMVVEIMQAIGIDEESAADAISVWPNPAVSELTIQTNKTDQRYVIYDNTGREITTGKLMQGFNKLSLDAFAAGNYILSVFANDVKHNYKIAVVR